MTGLLGIIAPLEVDLNLVLQIVMFIILGGGFYYKTAKNYRMHVSLMGMAVIFHVISFVTVMEPRLRAHSVNISISLQLLFLNWEFKQHGLILSPELSP